MVAATRPPTEGKHAANTRPKSRAQQSLAVNPSSPIRAVQRSYVSQNQGRRRGDLLQIGASIMQRARYTIHGRRAPKSRGSADPSSLREMVETPCFKRLILRAVLRQVSPMVANTGPPALALSSIPGFRLHHARIRSSPSLRLVRRIRIELHSLGRKAAFRASRKQFAKRVKLLKAQSRITDMKTRPHTHETRKTGK